MHTLQTLVRFSLFLLATAATACAAAAPTVPPTLVPAAAAARAATLAPATLPTTAPTAGAANDAVFTTTGAFFALSVADVNAGAKWYQDKFGLKITLQPPKANNSTVIVLEGGGLIVELIQVDGAGPLSEVAPAIKDKMLIHGIAKVGIIVDDFDKTVSTLRARNVKIVIGPYPKSSTQRANLIVEDNEGNLIQFFGN